MRRLRARLPQYPIFLGAEALPPLRISEKLKIRHIKW